MVEILPHDAEDGLEDVDEDGGNQDADALRKTRSAVIRTSTRQTIFLPVPGLVDCDELKPSDLIGVNKDSYLILEKLPSEFDSRVKAMEVDEKPSEDYSDIGGCDKQIQELIEAIVLPMTHMEMFTSIGIKPPKGVLLHGPPGTGKTLLARACANQSDAIFLKVSERSELVTTSVRVQTSTDEQYEPLTNPFAPSSLVAARGSSTGANVHWGRSKVGEGRIRSCEGEDQGGKQEGGHHLHR